MRSSGEKREVEELTVIEIEKRILTVSQRYCQSPGGDYV
jgi:hypothetical protein